MFSRKQIADALEIVLCADPFRSVAFFKKEGNKYLVVRATRRQKPDRRNAQTEIVLTLGRPNYAEREYLRKNGGDKPRLIEYKKPKKK